MNGMSGNGNSKIGTTPSINLPSASFVSAARALCSLPIDSPEYALSFSTQRSPCAIAGTVVVDAAAARGAAASGMAVPTIDAHVVDTVVVDLVACADVDLVAASCKSTTASRTVWRSPTPT
jgi:hypothetical protein